MHKIIQKQVEILKSVDKNKLKGLL